MSSNAPHYFFLGIQKSELKLFTDQIHEIDYKANSCTNDICKNRGY